MEQQPPQDPSASPDNQDDREVHHIRDLIEPTLDELARAQSRAEAADDEEVRAALQRQEELRRAAAKDHSFDDEYQAATAQVRALMAQRGWLPNPTNPGDSGSQ